MNKKSRLLWCTAAFAGLLVVFLTLPRAGSLVDLPAMHFTIYMGRSLRWQWLWKLAPVAVLAGVLLLWNKKRKQAFACLLSLLVAFELVSGVLFVRNARKDAAVTDPALLEEVRAVDDYLDAADSTATALVLADSPFVPVLRLLNTLSDNDYAMVTNPSVREITLKEDVSDPRRLSFAEQAFPCPVFEFTGKEDYSLTAADPVITIGKNTLLDPEQYEDVTPAGVTSMSVLRPKDPSVLALRDLLACPLDEPILFYGEDPAYVCFRPTGFSTPESSWCWTDGKEASLTLRPQSKPADLEVDWSFKMAHGEQPCQVYANDTLVLDDIATTDEGYFLFTVPKEAWPDGTLTLRFLFPQASPPGTSDTRELAVAFESITLSELSKE